MYRVRQATGVLMTLDFTFCMWWNTFISKHQDVALRPSEIQVGFVFKKDPF